MATAPSIGPPTYIARCAGVCKEESVDRLVSLLRGMCVRRNSYDENEYGMEMPLQSGTKRGSFKMIKQVPTHGPLVPLGPAPTIIWRLVHESPPLKGSAYNSLPAAVLEVSESALSGIYSVQFMHAMGCEITYKMARKNHVFVCMHEDQEVQVSLYTVYSREDVHQIKPLFPGSAVEVRLNAGPEQQVEAAKRLGTFCQKLLPMVLLKKV